MATVNVSTSIPIELGLKVESEAKKRGVSTSQILRELIEKEFQEHK